MYWYELILFEPLALPENVMLFVSEDGTEHSDVNLKPMWFSKQPWRYV